VSACHFHSHSQSSYDSEHHSHSHSARFVLRICSFICLLSLFVPATGDWRLWLEYGYRVTQARLGYQCPINVSMQCMQCRRDQRQASHDMAESLCCMLSLLQHSRPRRQATGDRRQEHHDRCSGYNFDFDHPCNANHLPSTVLQYSSMVIPACRCIVVVVSHGMGVSIIHEIARSLGPKTQQTAVTAERRHGEAHAQRCWVDHLITNKKEVGDSGGGKAAGEPARSRRGGYGPPPVTLPSPTCLRLLRNVVGVSTYLSIATCSLSRPIAMR